MAITLAELGHGAAASAYPERLTLVTYNTRDLERVEGLAFEIG